MAAKAGFLKWSPPHTATVHFHAVSRAWSIGLSLFLGCSERGGEGIFHLSLGVCLFKFEKSSRVGQALVRNCNHYITCVLMLLLYFSITIWYTQIDVCIYDIEWYTTFIGSHTHTHTHSCDWVSIMLTNYILNDWWKAACHGAVFKKNTFNDQFHHDLCRLQDLRWKQYWAPGVCVPVCCNNAPRVHVCWMNSSRNVVWSSLCGRNLTHDRMCVSATVRQIHFHFNNTCNTKNTCSHILTYTLASLRSVVRWSRIVSHKYCFTKISKDRVAVSTSCWG